QGRDNGEVPGGDGLMCYSGTCEFENSMGDCTVGDTLKFREKYKFSPCMVGGHCQEDEEFIKNHEQELSAIKRQYKEDMREEVLRW
ncbi:MAG: hypothetical protein ACI4EA_08070, partial [Candidatus Ornithomonoglobus sp.]